VTVSPQARPFMLSTPRPTYPVEARAQHITGRGVYDIFIDPSAGVVTRVTVVQSTGFEDSR
jgi:outer membrane biosynthesis protein TonB